MHVPKRTPGNLAILVNRVRSLSPRFRLSILSGAFLLLGAYATGQFADEYYTRDSLLIFNYSSDNDSTCLSRTFYETNENNLITVSAEYNYDDASSTWYEALRTAYGYNPFGLTDTSVIIKKSGISAEWVNSSAYAIEYDDLDRIIMRTDYRGDVTGSSWVGLMKRVFDFDEYGNLIYDASYGWDTNTGDWKGTVLHTWEMSPAGEELSQTQYAWDADSWQWIGSSKVVHLDDEQGIGPYDDIYHWDAVLEDWYLYDKSRSVQTLDGSGRPEETLFYNWDFGTETWILSAKNTFQYAEQGDTIYKAFYFWLNEAWEPASKMNRIFDENNNLVYFEYYNWNSSLGDFTGFQKYIRAYNASGEWTLIEDYYWNQDSLSFIKTGKRLRGLNEDGSPAYEWVYLWDQDLSDWKIAYKFFYYYTAISVLPAPQLSVVADTVGKYDGIDLICSQDARVYLVPDGTRPGDDLEQLSLGAVDINSLENGHMHTNMISDSGVYLLYAKNMADLVSLGKRVWITLPATSIAEMDFNGFHIYPTLTNQYITIESDIPVESVELYDLNGRLNRVIHVGGPSKTVDISELYSGIYYALPDGRKDQVIMILKTE